MFAVPGSDTVETGSLVMFGCDSAILSVKEEQGTCILKNVVGRGRDILVLRSDQFSPAKRVLDTCSSLTYRQTMARIIVAHKNTYRSAMSDNITICYNEVMRLCPEVPEPVERQV